MSQNSLLSQAPQAKDPKPREHLMSQDECEQIEKLKFDFTAIDRVMSEIKKSFWRVHLRKSHFNSQRRKYSDQCFNLM